MYLLASTSRSDIQNPQNRPRCPKLLTQLIKAGHMMSIDDILMKYDVPLWLMSFENDFFHFWAFLGLKNHLLPISQSIYGRQSPTKYPILSEVEHRWVLIPHLWVEVVSKWSYGRKRDFLEWKMSPVRRQSWGVFMLINIKSLHATFQKATSWPKLRTQILYLAL